MDVLIETANLLKNEDFEFFGLGELKSTGFRELVNDLGGHWEKLKDVCEGIPNNWTYLASFVC